MDVSAAPVTKPIWQSKTFWVAAVTTFAPFFPPVAVFIAANPWVVTSGLGTVFFALRLVSHGKVTIS
jgi:hypothetical protein